MDDKIFLGKYRISAEEINAAGELTGGSLAYRAQEIDSRKKVVVELLPTGSLKVAALERLEAEAVAAKKLNHVNIPALYDFGVEDDHLVYVTEDFEGTLAEEWVNTYGPMSVGPVLRVASQVVSALGAAAFHQIVHHAINPSNLVLVPGQTAEGEWPLVKVLHFVGVAPKLSGINVAVAAFDKSLHYASPEQIQKGTVDFRSEIYSLGCTMWFLLTGAPPLVAPKGLMAVTPATAEGNMSDMPKKVRRLLAQMLSANPETRSRDPLDFYRKLQECLVQVERRERMSRRFGVLSFSRAPAADAPAFRRAPMKALALAALFLAIATPAALVVPGYVRHRRIVRAQEPLGVPIGVPDAVAIATPVDANTASPMASDSTEATGALAQSNSPPSEAAWRAEADNTNALSPGTHSLESAGKNLVTEAPQPSTPDLSSNPRRQEPVPVAANNASTLSTTGRSEPASEGRVATARPGAHSTDTVAQHTAPKRIVMHEVRRAEPIELEVRRADPAPPGEGPESPAAETIVPAKPQRNAAPIQENRNVETETAEKTPRTVKRTYSERKVTVKPRVSTARLAKAKRRMDERIYMPERLPEFAGPMPQRSVRARFLGVTPDGRWILALPSKKIVIVPPPPPFP